MKKIRFTALVVLAAALVSCGKEEPKTLGAPQNLRAEAGANSLTFTWNKADGAVSYEYVLTEANGSPESSLTANNFKEFKNLKSQTRYHFKVRSVGADKSTSAWTETDAGTSGADPGPTPETGYALFKIPAEEDKTHEALAFPGAEGGGMYTSGGRGGEVYHVTNLNDSGAGSLREAVGKGGARTIVFDVAGIIHLKSTLEIKNGNLTIAGQTAPGDGICIADGTVQIKDGADNIIIRFMRFRLGDHGNDGSGGGLSDGSDAIWGRYASNIILDHCSMSWSVDEVASFYANKNFTMQWCNVSEAMNASLHDKGGHGYGGLWGGKNASFHHNLLSNNYSRNARIDHPGIYGSYLNTHRGNVDYRNNVIYNWGDNSTYGGEDGHYNMVNNYYKPGPASKDRKYFVDAYWYNSSSKVGSAYPVLYITGNKHTKYSEITTDNSKGIYYHDQSSYGTNPKGQVVTSIQPVKYNDAKECYTTTHSADNAFARVLDYVGACLRRDAVDQRHCKDAKDGSATYKTGSNGSTGGIIDSQQDVGGWPAYSASDAEKAELTDSDKDGMPDKFEEKFGLNKNNPDDAKTKTLDPYGRYTNLEMYLHYIVRDIVDGQIKGGTYTKLQ